jgi:FixJ family two-component response regulator
MTDLAPVIHLVDDDDAVRDSLSLLIESEGYKVQAHASAEAFLDACAPDSRGCAIIDLRMPGMGGMQLQEEMARRGFLLPIIFLTGYGDIPTSVRAIKAGAVDFLTKPVTGMDLLNCIADALAGADERQARASRNANAQALVSGLTGREEAVMRLVVDGLSNKEIGKRLGISHRTVEIHKANVMHKTGASTLMELAHLAREAGIAE